MTLATATMVLSACGGDSSTPSSLSKLVGFWEDSTSARKTLAALILPSGQHWVFYRNANGTEGFDQGNAQATGSSFRADMADYPNGFTQADDVTVTAQTATNSIVGTRVRGSVSDGFALTPMPSGAFDTQHSAQISDLRYNDWAVTLSGPGNTATLQVQTDGAFSGSSGGCKYNGKLSPMNNFNAFTVALTFESALCSQPGPTTGIAVVYHSTNNSTKMFIAVQDSSRQHGWLFSATR